MANEKCQACKDDKHSWCDRIMKSSSTCTCMNPMCSSLNGEKYHSP